MNRFRCLVPLVVAIGIIVAGCTKETNPLTPSGSGSDQQALQQQVLAADSIAEFVSSDEATIDDNGLRDPDYMGMAKESADLAGASGPLVGSVSADSIYPVRWGRHIAWALVAREYHVVMLGDTGAIVTIVKAMPGEFWVGLGFRGNTGIVIDTVIRKPFTEVVTRKVLFKRIARTADAMKNWAPVALTLVQGKTEGTSGFSVVSLEVTDASAGFDATVSDPLATWMRLGWRRNGTVPLCTAGDSVRVRVTISSTDDSNEIVVLRHSISGMSILRGRTRMPMISELAVDSNSFVRVYEKTFLAALPIGVLAARFNVVVDVIPESAILVNTAPFLNEFWGMPYIVMR